MAYNKQVNPYGIASSELGWSGFADGGRISSPGATQVKDPWWAEYAAAGSAAVGGKLFDYITEPTITKDVIGGDLVKRSNSAFDTYSDYLSKDKGKQAGQDWMMRKDEEGNLINFGKTKDEANAWALGELESISSKRSKLDEAYKADNKYFGDTIVTSPIETISPSLKSGYVYKGDYESYLEDELGKKGLTPDRKRALEASRKKYFGDKKSSMFSIGFPF